MKRSLIAAIAAVAASCGGSGEGPGPTSPSSTCSPPTEGFDLETAERKYAKLSDVCLFETRGGKLTPRAGVLPYDLTTPLFSDYTLKDRFVFVPKGKSAKYHPDAPLEFPVGTILVKTFSIAPDLRKPTEGARRIETRLLVRTAKEWVALPYVWNADRTEATLEITGGFQSLSFVAPDGASHTTSNYLVPNALQCRKCHDDANKVLGPIGPTARYLNRPLAYDDGVENQLARWTKVGFLQGAPAPEAAPKLVAWDDASASLDARARAYLEVNCAHCHSENGTARTSGLFLMANEKDPLKLGVCKPPVAAGGGSGGLSYSIVPKKPERSIFVYRMKSNDPKVMMPELGRSLVHGEGVKLVEEWIRAMPEASCTATEP